MLSKAKRRSNQKWNKKHPNKERIYIERSTMKRFLKSKDSGPKDWDDAEKIIKHRRKEMQ